MSSMTEYREEVGTSWSVPRTVDMGTLARAVTAVHVHTFLQKITIWPRETGPASLGMASEAYQRLWNNTKLGEKEDRLSRTTHALLGQTVGPVR